ncbi:MAG TPA: hypothetical protein PL029_03590 [Bacteroidia bacterium]|nr:hypothetical protein [Bacteroidia bacterium]
MLKPVKKRFDITVAAANQTVTQSFDLDKNIKLVHGVLVTSNKDDLLYYRGTQKIEINKEEYFPDNYESKLLMSGINVSPKLRYYDLGNINPGNGSVKIIYQDADDGRTVFSTYRVSLYLDCEMEDGQ